MLATSEVVTNALMHGTGTVRLAVGAGPQVVRVEVGDDSASRPNQDARPQARTAAAANPGAGTARRASTDEADMRALAERGRGMPIVEAVTSDWGTVDAPDGGKDVWFEVPTRP